MKEELKKYATPCFKKIVCEENHRKFIIHAGCSEFYKIKIDGDVEKNTKNKKCDFLIIKKDKEDIEIFIELKGKKVKDAFNQIIASCKKYTDNTKKPKLYAAIVTSHYKPPSKDTSIQNKQKELTKIFKRVPFIKNNSLEVKHNPEGDTIEKVN